MRVERGKRKGAHLRGGGVDGEAGGKVDEAVDLGVASTVKGGLEELAVGVFQ